jgi:hypothetical protein
MRHASRRDDNEAGIILQLRRVPGVSVRVNDQPGHPDLTVGYEGRTYLLEVIGDEKAKRYRTYGDLTPAQVRWHAGWKGHVAKVRTPADALRAIGVLKECA